MNMHRQRFSPEERRAIVLTAAVTVANDRGLAAVTWDAVARACTVRTSVGTAREYFKTLTALWRAVAADTRANRAVRDEATGCGIR